MTSTLAPAPAELALEAALAGGWTVTAGPAAVLMSEGLRPVLPADWFTRGEQVLVVTYAPSGRMMHATHTTYAGEHALARESEAGPEVASFVLDTLNR